MPLVKIQCHAETSFVKTTFCLSVNTFVRLDVQRWRSSRCIRLLDKKQSVVKCRLSPFYVVRLKLALAGYLSTNELKYCTFVGQPEKFRGRGGGEVV